MITNPKGNEIYHKIHTYAKGSLGRAFTLNEYKLAVKTREDPERQL